MTESILGELVGVFSGVTVCISLVYQAHSQLVTPTRSPLPAFCWLLWSVGFLGTAQYFLLVPRAPNIKTIGSPESPRTLGVILFGANLLCYLISALDTVNPATSASLKTKHVTRRILPSFGLSALFLVLLSIVHYFLIQSRVLFRELLFFVAILSLIFYFTASVLSTYKLSVSQITRGGADVAGLHWISTVMRILGYFTGIFACTIIYTNPDWYSVTLLVGLLIADALYIGVSKYRVFKHVHYSRIPTNV